MSLVDKLSILNLDDDCLLEIFKRTPIWELYNARNVCKRFNVLIDYHFSMAYKSLNFSHDVIKNDPHSLLTLDETRNILNLVGGQIQMLTVNADSFESSNSCEVLGVINEYCGDQRLEHLKLTKFALDDQVIETCKRLFSNVIKLTIDKCHGHDKVFEKLLDICTEMKEFDFLLQPDCNLNVDKSYLLKTYPKLEGLILRSNDNFRLNYMNKFFIKNPQIKKFKCIGCYFIDDELFPMIADNLLELETLTVHLIGFTSSLDANLLDLLKLQKLKNLEFNCDLKLAQFVKGLAMTNTIETLGISSAEMNQKLCNALCTLKNLRVLKLISMYDIKPKCIKELAENLKNLKEFHLIGCAGITYDNALALAPKLEKLVVNKCCDLLPLLSEDRLNLLINTFQEQTDKLDLLLPLLFGYNI